MIAMTIHGIDTLDGLAAALEAIRAETRGRETRLRILGHPVRLDVGEDPHDPDGVLIELQSARWTPRAVLRSEIEPRR